MERYTRPDYEIAVGKIQIAFLERGPDPHTWFYISDPKIREEILSRHERGTLTNSYLEKCWGTEFELLIKL